MATKPQSAGAAAPPSAPASQELPKKDQGMFQQIVECYEKKKYKKGIKAADALLKKYPNHGETLAMKGLILNCEKRPDEAKALVKKGLALNLKSHVCWHVYGLIYRADRQYDEAIKCYANALKFDKDNLQILKDMAVLQVQQRDTEGFADTRRRILTLKPAANANWVAFAIGTHLTGKPDRAVKILSTFIETLTEEKDKTSYETSEILLYKAVLLREDGKLEEALKHLVSCEGRLRDRISTREMKGEIYLEMGKYSEAEQEYRELLKINPECHEHHYALRNALRLSPDAQGRYSAETVSRLKELYASLLEQYPKCAAVKRLPLDFLSGGDFRTSVHEHMIAHIRKGIPSLFRDLKPLYSDAEKRSIVQEAVETFITNLRQHSKFSAGDQTTETPSSLLWALFYAGNHYDFIGDHVKALAYTNDALAHTPTTIDLYVLKARIYKHVGDFERAFECMNRARQMDLADRYLNVKCVRYAHRHSLPDEATNIVSLFLKEGDTMGSLFDMQVMWFELSAGDMYLKRKEYGRALKCYGCADKHFDDFIEDQFDFHSYCLRKMTIRTYLDMLKWGDNVRSHRLFFRAATSIVKTYLEMHEKPAEDAEAAAKSQEDEFAGLSEEERKKAERAKKKKAFAGKSDEKDDNKNPANGKEKLILPAKQGEPDPDPVGDKLVEGKDFLEEATKSYRQLERYSSHRIETHVLGADIFTRKRKFLLALRSLKRAAAIDASHPQLIQVASRFARDVKAERESLTPVVREALDAELHGAALFGGRLNDAKQLLSTFIGEHKQSTPHLLAASEVLLRQHNSDSARAEALQLIQAIDTNRATLKEALLALHLTSKVVKNSDEAEKLKARFAARFPLTPAFMNADQLATRQKIRTAETNTESAEDADGKAES